MEENNNGMSWFGVWLKTVLDDCGMKQRDLAKVMNTSEACVSRWIRGGRVPARKQLNWMLDYFGYHLEIVPNGFNSDAVSLLKEQEAVVRCKDCKNLGYTNSHWFCKWLNRCVDDDWFCADGERRTDDA